MNVRLFAFVTALGGGCIGVPLYLLQSGKTSEITVQSAPTSDASVTRTISNDISPEQKSIAKGRCTVIETPQEIKDFLGENYKDSGDYVLVSCTNTNLQIDYAPLPLGWMGWLPNFMFSDKSSTTLKSNLEINTETKVEHDNWGSYTEITFVGDGLRRVYKGKLNILSPKNLEKEVHTVSVWENGHGNKLIYLFVPKSDSDSE